MSTTTTHVLITGSARGIGRSLTAAYLSRPRHTVIAAVRDLDSQGSKSLKQLPAGEQSQLVLLKIDSSSEQDPFDAIKELESVYKIDRLDVVIANAGISNYFGLATVTPAKEMTVHYHVNVVGPLLLFQATAPLLSKASGGGDGTLPKFVAISSGAGSIQGIEKLKVENTAYGASKAALNFVVRRIHAENPNLIAFPINPGWLQTELGNHAASNSGMAQAPVSVDEGVRGIIGIIDKATRQDTSGRFMSANGQELDW